ncbi:54S ribosomal protein L40, mitochondrial [Hanseniaspora osmophila]|uniref:54S ribosomal protein L40, mitochondrial n=1 Tax=Hanseniaspora osmophila TaxID=56408 RepID=A0A1E5R849_9ASCO|nr:54S ribosomal protein L40, mitochondrial [Hanseniaspora osmophila]
MQVSQILKNQASQVTKQAKLNRFLSEKKMLQGLPTFIRPQLDSVPEDQQFKTELQWKYLPGDKVVYLDKGSKYHGNFCTVTKQNQQSNGFQLDHNGPMKQTPTPKSIWAEGQSSYIVPTPQLVTQKQIKLVVEIKDKITNELKKVVVDDVEFKGTYFDERYHKRMPVRFARGEKIVIPWPKPDLPEQEDVLGTNAENVRTQTFWPTSLVQSPIPVAALSDIRNHNSPQQFVKKQITPAVLRKLTPPKMPKTDVQKARIQERNVLHQQEKARKATLTNEEKEKIGEKIYQHLSKNITD